MKSPTFPSDPILLNAYHKALETYRGQSGVTGVDCGFRYSAGKRTKELGLRVHMAHKLFGPTFNAPAAKLEATFDAANDPHLPSIDGVPCLIIRAEYRRHAAPGATAVSRRTDPVDPIQPGVSISHEFGAGGTLGLIVVDSTNNQSCMLSNHHVLFGTPNARSGDTIVQPSADHNGVSPAADAGKIVRGHRDRMIDAAIAVLGPFRPADVTIFGTTDTVRAVGSAELGDVVKKSGAATDVTQGIVDGFGTYFVDDSGPALTEMEGFRIVLEEEGNPGRKELSRPGDSGAVWYTVGTNLGVGLHVAGEIGPATAEEFAVACHLDHVFDQLNLSVAR